MSVNKTTQLYVSPRLEMMLVSKIDFLESYRTVELYNKSTNLDSSCEDGHTRTGGNGDKLIKFRSRQIARAHHFLATA